jgi:CRP-like cAMP-binding protein
MSATANTAISDLATRDYREVARHAGAVRALAPGEALFREGEAADEMHVLLTGAIAVRARGTVIETVLPGDGLGILSLIDGRPRSATAVAVEPSEVAVLDARKFRFLVESAPGFVWFVMGEMAQRLRATNAQL